MEKTNFIETINVICLTLADQRKRQLLVVSELENLGIRHYELFPGYGPNDEKVHEMYERSAVKKFPSCFRCNEEDCGDPNCNNIIMPHQVAVALGYQSIFNKIKKSDANMFMVCEDDIVFSKSAKTILESSRFHSLLESSGIFGGNPTLIRLAKPELDMKFNEEVDLLNLSLTSEVVMSNPCFLVNKAFARVASDRLSFVDSTADVIIHNLAGRGISACTLNVQLVSDRSWCSGELPSLIHPKQKHVDFLEEQNANGHLVEKARRALSTYTKKAVAVDYCFIGSPRCGSHFVSSTLKHNLLDVGHEELGKHGICAWQYTVDCEKYPYIIDNTASNSFFVYPKKWLIYCRNPISAIPSLIIENSKAPLSYAFRRKLIYENLGINLDSFGNDIERAARSYIHWYQLALRRNIYGILRVENFFEDFKFLFPDTPIKKYKLSNGEDGAGKKYLNFQHKPLPLPEDWHSQLSSASLLLLSEVSNELGYKT